MVISTLTQGLKSWANLIRPVNMRKECFLMDSLTSGAKTAVNTGPVSQR
jgi:hypothetical protein